MRYGTATAAGSAKPNMTPMIDMVFQLIAFFMVVVNFAEADQNLRIHLPSSELAKPPEVPLQSPLTLQLTEAGTVIFGPDEMTIEGLRPYLMRERAVINATPGRSVADATVIIRADRNAKTGKVQELMKICQNLEFTKFALRAKQQQTDL
jgi:biopolymer transport protein ExbD